MSVPNEMTPELRRALKAWARWYSARLARINAALDAGWNVTEAQAGAEQDVFEAIGCEADD